VRSGGNDKPPEAAEGSTADGGEMKEPTKVGTSRNDDVGEAEKANAWVVR